MGQVATADIYISIANELPQYRHLREVSKRICATLDSDEHFTARQDARGVFAYELPLPQVIPRLPTETIWIHLNRPRGELTITDDGLRALRRYIHWGTLGRRQSVSVPIYKEFCKYFDSTELQRSPYTEDELLLLLYKKDYIRSYTLLKRMKCAPTKVIKAAMDNGYYREVATRQALSTKLIEKHLTEFSNDDICSYQILDLDFIERHKDWVDWDDISLYQRLSESFIRDHAIRVNWESISRTQIMSVDFIVEMADKINWTELLVNNDFTEAELDVLAALPQFDWDCVSEHQILSMHFIREHIDQLDIRMLSRCQALDVSFLREYAGEINWRGVVSNEKICLTREEKIEFIDYLFP
jgi:hypothetical protein